MIRPLTQNLMRRIYGAHDVAVGSARHVLSHTFDICVIGSGCGGTVAASTLAAGGRDVVLLERGPFRPPKDYTFQALDMATRLGHLELTRGHRPRCFRATFWVEAASSTAPSRCAPLHTCSMNGSGRPNSRISVRRHWNTHYDEVGTSLSVTRQSTALENRPNAIVRQMAHALGRPEGLHVVQRYTAGCAGVGLCNFGCAVDRKGTMLNSFLPMGLETGRLTVLTEANVHGLEGERRSGFYQPQLRVSRADRQTQEPTLPGVP